MTLGLEAYPTKTQHLVSSHLEAPDTLSVINFSDQQLSHAEQLLLSKGLSFCPTADTDTFELIKDVHIFARKSFFLRPYTKRLQSRTLLQQDL